MTKELETAVDDFGVAARKYADELERGTGCSMDRAELEMIESRNRLLSLANDANAQLAAVDAILGVEHAPLTRIEEIERLINERDVAVRRWLRDAGRGSLDGAEVVGAEEAKSTRRLAMKENVTPSPEDEDDAARDEALTLLKSISIPKGVAEAAVNWASEHDSAQGALVWVRKVVQSEKERRSVNPAGGLQ